MRITAEFVISAASAADLPRDGLSEVAMVGRSNVGKSSLINALVKQRVARTSAAPGKTRLANVYRVTRGASSPFYLVDLPGYGYARGGDESAREFDTLVRAYFEQGRERGQTGRDRFDGPERQTGQAGQPAHEIAALLLVDLRHPGLTNDRAAWQWIQRTAAHAAIVGTKVDKLARGERIRAMKTIESVFEGSVLPVSAVTGEGLDELWKLIDRLANSRTPPPRSTRASQTAPRKPTPPPKPAPSKVEEPTAAKGRKK